MSHKQSKKHDRGEPSSKITDSRFSNFETDPRYALPSKRKGKTTIDKRFSRMLKDDEFTATSKVDRYGRKLKSDSKKLALQRLYEEEDEKEDGVKFEDDDVVERELEKATKFDPARGGGFSSSESESEEDEEDEEADVDNAPDMQRFQTEQNEVPTGDITNRIAIVNIDWDNIKSVDLMALFSSFVPVGGRIEKVAVFPSEFGKERMQREELEGPPKEIFKKKADEESDDYDDDSEGEADEDDEDADSDEEAKNELLQEGNDEDFDHDALRTYQLDRLRYYYAIMTCSDENTAHKIYEATDGSEYLSSSNFLDLRFVPNDVTFDDEPRDECTKVPENYKPVDFVTDALQHSKVKLTWDMHPEEAIRQESIKNAFSGSRTDIAENDLKAYLASDSEDEDDEEEGETAAEEDAAEPKLSKKELARRKMREALGLSVESSEKPSKSGPVGDMQITFSSALTDGPKGKKGEDTETTVEKYIRKEKDRKSAKKEAAKAKREGDVAPAEDEAQEELGFNDPFFTAEEPTKVSRSAKDKEHRRKKREAREAESNEHAAEKARLQLLMDETHDGEAEHFDIREIERAEKHKNRKRKGKRGAEDRGGLQEDFDMDVEDSRFGAVFDDHQFAIDPSNPKFKATPMMKKLLEAGRKKRKHRDDDEEVEEVRNKSKSKKVGAQNDLDSLVKSIKKKSKLR